MTEWEYCKTELYEGFYRINGDCLEIKGIKVKDKEVIKRIAKAIEEHSRNGLNISTILIAFLPEKHFGRKIENKPIKTFFATDYLFSRFILTIPLEG